MAKVVSISAGAEHTLALTDAGTVLSWGNGPQLPADLNGVIAIAAGAYVSLALLNTGEVVGWGFTEVPNGLTDVVAIAAGGRYCAATRKDGTVVCWGKDFPTGPTESVPWVLGGDEVTISKSGGFGLALEDGGRVVRQDISGHFNGSVPEPDSRLQHGIKSISAGFAHGLALSENGNVYTWAEDRQMATANLHVPFMPIGATAIAAGGAFNIALLRDRTIFCWGHNQFGQTEPPRDLTDVVMVSAGTHFGAALTQDGKVAVWGRNNNGQAYLPIEIAYLTTDSGPKRPVAPLILNSQLQPFRLTAHGAANEEEEMHMSLLPGDNALLEHAKSMSKMTTYEDFQYEGPRAAACSLNDFAARKIVLGQPEEAIKPLLEAELRLANIPQDADGGRFWREIESWVPIARAAICFNYILALRQIGGTPGQIKGLFDLAQEILVPVQGTHVYQTDGFTWKRVQLVRNSLSELKDPTSIYYSKSPTGRR